MKLNITKEWLMKRIELEEQCESVNAGSPDAVTRWLAQREHVMAEIAAAIESFNEPALNPVDEQEIPDAV